MNRCFSGDITPTTKRGLAQHIIEENPNARPEIVEELEGLVNKYGINWIPNIRGEGGYFISSQLSLAKGNDVYDFAKHWKDNKDKVTSSFMREGIHPLVMKLVGDELKTFKSLWDKFIGSPLGRVPSLYVCSWPVAYWYLTRGTSEAAIEFTNLGAKAVAGTFIESEQSIQDKIALLSTYSTDVHLTQEVTVLNVLDDKTRTRRFDLVERKGRKDVIIYELKKDVITLEHVARTIGEKGYLELAIKKYRGKNVKLVFLSPNGIEDAALRLIKYNPYLSYIPLSKLLERIKRSILRRTPSAGSFKFEKDIFPRLSPGV